MIIFILTVLSEPAGARLPLSSATYTKHFIIRHDPDFKSTADVIGDACESWLSEISKNLEVDDIRGEPIPVFLYQNQQEFKEGTGRERPGLTVGLASSHGYIELDASGVFASAEQIAGHEIVHVVIFRILGDDIDLLPLWVNEGAAKFFTQDWDIIDRTTLANAITRGEIIPLSSLTDRFPRGRETLAYSQSASAVRFLVDTYGESAPARLIHATVRTRSFDAAMHEVTGGSPAQFEQQWRQSIEGRIAFSRLLRFASIVGLLSMPVLAIAAYLAIRRRQRRMIERYEQEEWEEANWRDWTGG